MSLSKKWPLILLLIYIVEFTILAFKPYSRVIWITENSLTLVTVFVLMVMYLFRVRFSNLAYTFMAIFIYAHTVGGHYTFELVPFDFVTDLFGFERNHFDRMCHFMVGFFALPMLELVEERQLIRGRFFSIFMVVMAVFGFAAIFELVEWIYAELADPTAGNAFLGSQGDIWDAQKDMLADGLGAIFSSIVFTIKTHLSATSRKSLSSIWH